MKIAKNYSDDSAMPHNGKRISRREIISLKAKESIKRTWSEKAADYLAESFGTLSFLVLNAAVFIVWILVNLGILKDLPFFDPFPFGLLTMIVSLEAIFLSIIVLISQNRAAKIGELREEIDLQVNTIAEQEITKIMEMLSKIMEQDHLNPSSDPVLQEMLKPTDMKKIEDNLNRQL